MKNFKNYQLKVFYLYFMYCILINYPVLGQNISYTPLYTNSNFTKTINLNLPVGTTEGMASSNNGAGIYSIPLITPSGTNGMEPQVALNYSSLGGNGIMGVGWGVSGLSMISRSGKNLYMDGKVEPVNIDNTDVFNLDGARLISKSGVYGSSGSTYGPESEDFSTITSLGNVGGGPEYFQVEHKSGVIYEYGKTMDSRYMNSNGTRVLFWRLNRIISKEGNYVDYKYVTINNEVLLDEISYTGNINTGLLPYNKIKFQYLNKLDQNTVYEAGTEIKSNTLLYNIVITTENNFTFKSYSLFYGNDNISSYLKEIVEYGADGDPLNSTIFKYGDVPIAFEFTNSSIFQGSAVDLFSGDFDGDGYSDILVADYAYHNNNVKYHTGFRIFKRTESNPTFVQAYSETFPSGQLFQIVNNINTPKNTTFVATDFTGDGRDDIMINRLSFTSTGGYQVEFYRLYTSTSSGNHTCTFAQSTHYPHTQSSGCSGPYNRFPAHLGDGQYFYPGDFNGDGAVDFLTILSNGGGFKVFLSFPRLGIYNKEIVNINSGCYCDAHWVHSDYRFVIDYDGDGKSDLLITKGSITKIFSFSQSGNNWIATEKYSAGYPTKWHLLYFADFNGDGKTDILARTSKTNNNAPWYKSINTGAGFIETPLTFTKTPNITGSYSDDKMILSDFNGDGKNDIYHAYVYFPPGSSSASTSRIDMYYSRGNNFFHNQQTYSSLIGFVPNVPLDYNGDGRANVINRTHFQNPFQIFFFRKEGQERLLQKVKNGVDYNVEFLYQRMTQTSNSFYTKGTITQHPVNNIQAPVYLVSQLKSENGIGGFATTDYRYEEAKLHKEGKGFLGFGSVISIDNVLGYRTTIQNELNSTFFALTPQIITKHRHANNLLLNQITSTNQFINLGSKRFWVRVNSSVENKAFEGQTISNSFTYDNFGNITQSVTNVNNIETTTVASQYGQHGTPVPAKLTSRTVSVLRTAQALYSKTQTYSYNSLGQMTQSTDFSGLPKSVQTTFAYNSFGNQISKTISASGITSRTYTQQYDSKGRNVISVTNPLSQTTTFVNDLRWSQPTSITDITGQVIQFSYDAFGRQISSFDTQRNITVTNSYTWDVNNSVGTIHRRTISHPGKPNNIEWYDKLDRLKRQDVMGYGNAWSSKFVTYDARGNMASETLPYKSGENVVTTTYSYDIYNRPSSVSSPIGSTTYSYAYSGGNLTTSITNPAGQVKSSISDATGKTISVTDHGGTLSYTYYSHGNIRNVSRAGTVLTSHLYDEYARQTQLMDINAGTTNYVTDALGQITSMTTATNQTITYTYDILGRKTSYNRPEGSTTYSYYPSGSGGATNRLNTVSTYGNITEQNVYDAYGRLVTKTETVDGIVHTFTHTYDIYDNVTSVLYPSGFMARYNYDTNGYLQNIRNGNNTVTIYTQTSTNGLGQTTGYSMGNSKSSTIEYDYGIPKKFTTAGVQNLTLNWNYQTGNLTNRVDAIKNKTESFTYDNLNRLLNSSGSGISTITTAYAQNGNISSKTDVGGYTYGISKINAVTEVTNSPSNISALTQNIVYTSFYQPLNIVEGSNRIDFVYAANDQRIKAERRVNNTIVNTRYYFGEYEKDITSGVTRHIHYITTPSGLSCIVERIGSTDNYRYVYTDHLGSILTVTSNTGAVLFEQNFDAWGRDRNPSTWAYTTIPPTPPTYLYRGYTGHEHLPQFGLINMNGRLYDPLLARMLSPDNHIQMPDNTQNYNRYSYVFNNPLSYTDPDGEVAWFVPVIIGAVAGAYVGASIQSGTAAFWNWQSDAWKGAIAGAIVGATLGYAISGAIGASGMTTVAANGASVSTKAAGITSSMLNSGSINIGINAFSGGGWDGAWKAGVVGLATGGWNSTGGFGMVKGFGSTKSFAKLGGKLGYQMIGTAGSSIGNNWARGKNPFSMVTLGVGPINLTLGKGQKLLQWKNNIGNIATNAFGLGNMAFGGRVNFDWRNLSINYSGGIIDKFYDPKYWYSGFGAHTVIGNSRLLEDQGLYSHELHHLWQSRAFGDMFLLNYGFQGIGAMLMGGSFLEKYNYFEDQAYGSFWW